MSVKFLRNPVCYNQYQSSAMIISLSFSSLVMSFMLISLCFFFQPQHGCSMSACASTLSPSLPFPVPPSAPSTLPLALSAPLSSSYPRITAQETFGEKLSKALESVLPMHITSPRNQRRSSLPSLFVSPVCHSPDTLR